MLTREQLAEWLKGQNVEAIAAAANVSTKTIYRIRSGKKNPSWETLQALMALGAVAPGKPAKRARKPAAEAQA